MALGSYDRNRCEQAENGEDADGQESERCEPWQQRRIARYIKLWYVPYGKGRHKGLVNKPRHMSSHPTRDDVNHHVVGHTLTCAGPLSRTAVGLRPSCSSMRPHLTWLRLLFSENSSTQHAANIHTCLRFIILGIYSQDHRPFFEPLTRTGPTTLASCREHSLPRRPFVPCCLAPSRA